MISIQDIIFTLIFIAYFMSNVIVAFKYYFETSIHNPFPIYTGIMQDWSKHINIFGRIIMSTLITVWLLPATIMILLVFIITNFGGIVQTIIILMFAKDRKYAKERIRKYWYYED